VATALLAIGRQVRDARAAAGISQTTLEKLTGLDQTTISRVERGRAPRLPLVRLARLFAALGSELCAEPGNSRDGALAILDEAPTDDDETWRSIVPRRPAMPPAA
jgi:transcriptional regulator with XRE-family HTH domain